MTFRDMIPWGRHRELSGERDTEHPLNRIHGSIDRLFDDFMDRIGGPMETETDFLSPRIDLAETDKEITVTAEMPGLDEKDIEVSLERDHLVVRGHKQAEKEEKGKHIYRAERSYGAFHRAIPLPCEIDDKKVKAVYKKGLLTIRLPKSPDAIRHHKRVEIH
ncbi:Hsp20/alpha crystallin family protein [Desulfuromonas sp.]|uniref:Hsp20/alpha crystallin family protein n=1 Tax=Desulfuromonas sp. TaxID=892 RepID=UPI0025C3A30F|nr:Hsp20/alpha crystallin family protein [Desulfuromonas sp.]